MFGFGLTTLCTGFVRNYGGFIAARLVLGVAEAGKESWASLLVCRDLLIYIVRNFPGLRLSPGLVVHTKRSPEAFLALFEHDQSV